jgi:hypothetical protein
MNYTVLYISALLEVYSRKYCIDHSDSGVSLKQVTIPPTFCFVCVWWDIGGIFSYPKENWTQE